MTAVYDELHALLTDRVDQHDLTRAPQLLQLAFLWCAETLEPHVLHQLNRVDVLTILAALVKALHHGQVFLHTAIPQALDQAVAGTRLREALREGEAAVAHGAQELERLREELASLWRQQEKLKAQAAEYTSLQQRRAELERLARLAPAIPELAGQVEELVRRLPAAGHEAAAQEQHIENTARSVIRLSQDTLANLRTGARQALELAHHLDQERQQAETQLQEALTRQQQAEADLQKLTFNLRPHLTADRRSLRRLPLPTRPTAFYWKPSVFSNRRMRP